MDSRNKIPANFECKAKNDHLTFLSIFINKKEFPFATVQDMHVKTGEIIVVLPHYVPSHNVNTADNQGLRLFGNSISVNHD